MARSQSKPSFIFSAGCLFILLVTAVQVWRLREERLTPRIVETPAIDFPAPAPPQYRAEIRAEVALPSSQQLAREARPAGPVATKIEWNGPRRIDVPLVLDGTIETDFATNGTEPFEVRDSLAPLFDDQLETWRSTAAAPEFPYKRPAKIVRPKHLAAPKAIQAALAPAEPPPVAEPDTAGTLDSSVPSVVEKPVTPPAKADRPIVIKRLPKKTPAPKVAQKQGKSYAHPHALLKAVKAFNEPSAVEWGQRVNDSFSRLLELESLDAMGISEQLADLRRLHGEAIGVVRNVDDVEEQSLILSAAYGVSKRLATYESILGSQGTAVDQAIQKVRQHPAYQQIGQSVAQARQALGQGATAEQWTEFLELDDLEGLAQSDMSSHQVDRVNLATRVLDRIATPNTSEEQHRVLSSDVIRRLQYNLRFWATGPVDFERLLLAMENYEANPTEQVAEYLSRRISQMRWSLVPHQNQMSRVLDSHYRNANMRVAMTQEFLNRMLPVIQDSRSPVREELLGARVFGNSATWSRPSVEFVPDDSRINLTLRANGVWQSETQAYKGPVVTFNQNHSRFYLEKNIILNGSGILVGRSSAVASGTTNLLGLKTDYDRYPLIGSIVRRAAKKQVFEQRNLARRIMQRRVASGVETKVDRQVTEKLTKTRMHVQDKIVDPLKRMSLNPETINMETTEDRIVFRGRLSGYHQLAAFTARPRALASNLVSFQIHESTANNLIQQLHLNGTKGNLRELLDKAMSQAKNFDLKVPEDVPEKVEIELASHDAMRVYFDEGKVRFTLRVAKLSTPRRDWKNFAVSANFVPEIDGLQIKMARDGVVELSGRRLNLRDQVALRGIFGKVFSKNRKIDLIDEKVAQDDRLNDLAFSQVVFRDGWLGVSMDSDRTETIADVSRETVR